MDKHNPPERIDPVDLIRADYEAVEMSDALRLDMQNRTRAVVAARRKMPMIRWAASLAGVAAVVAVIVLCWRFAAAPPSDRGTGQAHLGSTLSQHEAQRRTAKAQGGAKDVEATPRKSAGPAEQISRSARNDADDTGSTPKAAPKLGAPLVVVISAQRPVTNGAGKALNVGDRVASGDVVRTGRGGRVALVTRKGSEMNLDSNSSLVLTASNIATITRGRLYCSNHDKEIARIDTPAGRVKLLGTVVDANVVRKDTVAVTVVEGRVQLSNRHGNALVDAGKRSLLMAFRPPQSGTAVNTYKETAWYHGRGDYQSDFGDIAYTVSRADGLMTEIWSVAADGSGRHRVCSFIGSADSAGWIPGGRWLNVEASGILWYTPDVKTRTANAGAGHPMLGDRVMLLEAATRQIAPFGLPDGYHPMYQALAPDPALMAFTGYYLPEPGGWNGAEGGLWVCDSRSGSIKRVLNGSIKTAPAWAPDSRHIAISKGEDYRENHCLVIVDAVTGEVRDLGIDGAGASYSPDGTKLAYSGEFTGRGSWWAGVPTSGSIFVVDLVNGGQPVRVSSGRGGAIMPRWSPDGSRILYVSHGDGAYVVGADGTGPRQVFEGKVSGQPSWAPDGRGIYLSTKVDGASQTLLVAADGSGVVRRVAESGGKRNTLPLNVRAQADAAASAIREAIFLYAMGHVAAFDGDLAARSENLSASADIFSRLVWDYPLSGLTPDDALAYADLAAQELARSDGEVLRDNCSQRMNCAGFALRSAVSKHKQFPQDMATLVEWAQFSGWQWNWLRSSDVEHVKRIGGCPGTVAQGPVMYVYVPPAPGEMPKIGDVILNCPLHPDNCFKWDEQCARALNRPLMNEGKPGARCQVERTPYWFENAGGEELTVVHHSVGDTYEIKGEAKLLPTGKIYSNESMQLGALDEGSIARAIDAAGAVDWGGLSGSELSNAQNELDFCRAVAKCEAKLPITDCKVLDRGNLYKAIDGEPARLLFSGPAGGSCGASGSGLRFELIGPGDILLYQLKPSGRFRVWGTVRVQHTRETCKNGWIDKGGKVISTEK